MNGTDRLPEIQARAANGIADQADIDWLITEVQQLRTEKAIAERTCEEAAGRMDQLRAEVDEYERCFAIPGEEAA